MTKDGSGGKGSVANEEDSGGEADAKSEDGVKRGWRCVT